MSADQKVKPRVRYLYSVTAASGSLTGPRDADLTLRLSGSQRYVTRFTDRPQRRAWVLHNRSFAEDFNRLFAGAAPNAVLTYQVPGEAAPRSLILTISSPIWHLRGRTWVFTAKRIRRRVDNVAGATRPVAPPRIPNPHQFRGASLVIDDASSCVLAPNASLAGCDFSNQTIIGANAAGADLRQANFAGALIEKSSFVGADLSSANFSGTIGAGDNFANATLGYANFGGARFNQLTMTKADLSGATFLNAVFSGSNFTGANLTSTTLVTVAADSSNFTNANLAGANLGGTNLQFGTLTGAITTDTFFCNTRMPDGTINNSGIGGGGCTDPNLFTQAGAR